MVARLHAAGAVLVAKLSLGALALNDVWFGGQTMNPWLLEEGSSGSSAGPGAATAAGLVGFSIGSETGGSIVAPSMRCGVTGLRPTYGRVPRTGAMTLCWSLDKLGPMARGVEDTLMVLHAIIRPGCGRFGERAEPSRLRRSRERARAARRIFPRWMKERPATEVDRAALETIEKSRNGSGGGFDPRLAVRFAEFDFVCRRRRGFRRTHSQRRHAANSRRRSQMRGRTYSAKRASCRPSTLCRRTACAEKSRTRWRA